MPYASPQSVSVGGAPLLTLWDMLDRIGRQANAKLCLDAGDALSWTGSGQKWLDRTAGGCDFFLGASGSASTDDPTFVGTVGDLRTAGWQFDGGDFFLYDTSNESFMNGWHGDNALFTWLALVNFASPAIDETILATMNTPGSQNGTSFLLDHTGHLGIYNSTGASVSISHYSTVVVGAGAHFLGMAIDEAGGAAASRLQIDSVVETFNGAYAFPTASGASQTMRLGAWGDGLLPLANTSKLIGFAALDVALSSVELAALWPYARARLGI